MWTFLTIHVRDVAPDLRCDWFAGNDSQQRWKKELFFVNFMKSWSNFQVTFMSFEWGLLVSSSSGNVGSSSSCNLRSLWRKTDASLMLTRSHPILWTEPSAKKRRATIICSTGKIGFLRLQVLFQCFREKNPWRLTHPKSVSELILIEIHQGMMLIPQRALNCACILFQFHGGDILHFVRQQLDKGGGSCLNMRRKPRKIKISCCLNLIIFWLRKMKIEVMSRFRYQLFLS